MSPLKFWFLRAEVCLIKKIILVVLPTRTVSIHLHETLYILITIDQGSQRKQVDNLVPSAYQKAYPENYEDRSTTDFRAASNSNDGSDPDASISFDTTPIILDRFESFEERGIELVDVVAICVLYFVVCYSSIHRLGPKLCRWL